MRKLKTFWHVLTRSLTDPLYYGEILSTKLWFSFQYFLFYFFLLTVANTAQFTLQTLPIIESIITQTISDIDSNYPEDMVMTFTPGTLDVSGYPTPISLPFNSAMAAHFNSGNTYEYALTIAPDSQVAINNSLLTLTQNNLIYRAADDTKESIGYARLLNNEPVIVDREYVSTQIREYSPFIEGLIDLAPGFFFVIVLIIAPLSALVLTGIYTFFIYTISSLTNAKLPYKKVFQLGLHAVTFAETVGFLQSLLFPTNLWSYLYPISFFGTMSIVLYVIRSKNIQK